MTEKLYVTYEEIHQHVKSLADKIAASQWEPDVIVAIASGGFIPARILKTYLKKEIYVVGLRRYDGEIGVLPEPQKIQWIDEVERKLQGKKILLVDEVDDTRITLGFCLRELLTQGPKEIRVAVIHQKLKPKGDSFPDQVKVIYEAQQIPDLWIKYPWDALDIEEHNQHKA